MAAKKEKKAKKKSCAVWDVFDLVEIFTVCTAVIVVLFSLFVRLTVVDGHSMDDTLHDGQYLLVRNIFYEPERGDIVVVHDPSQPNPTYADPLVKRIIAIGGDTIEIEDGLVYVNGEVIKDSYIKEPMHQTHYDKITLGEHQVFVMGDNRNNSGDSRTFGPIDERCVIGRAIARLYPFDTISLLPSGK